jgi:glycine/D-amino acid oxidase-like deaminating enzyme
MQVDFIIVGQGISGSWLSYYLLKEGKTIHVIDDNRPATPSRIAAGIINPVTGRRHVTVWMAEELLPFAWTAYQQIGQELDITAISHKNLLDFFPSPQMRESFLSRVEEGTPYLHAFPEQNKFNSQFSYDFGCGETRPVYIVHLETLLPVWRNYLSSKNILLEEKFERDELVEEKSGLRYRDISAQALIFCDGTESSFHPWFRNLPFASNKGEALIVEIPGLPPNYIYKKGLVLAPLAQKDHWWVGSNYEWEFDHADPTKEFRERTEKLLNEWLKSPFRIVDHFAAIRPATVERRPFVGMHPLHPGVGILNGMGTKGCALAPFFARQLTDHLVYHLPIHPDASVSRFERILSRGR